LEGGGKNQHCRAASLETPWQKKVGRVGNRGKGNTTAPEFVADRGKGFSCKECWKRAPGRRRVGKGQEGNPCWSWHKRFPEDL